MQHTTPIFERDLKQCVLVHVCAPTSPGLLSDPRKLPVELPPPLAAAAAALPVPSTVRPDEPVTPGNMTPTGNTGSGVPVAANHRRQCNFPACFNMDGFNMPVQLVCLGLASTCCTQYTWTLAASQAAGSGMQERMLVRLYTPTSYSCNSVSHLSC